MRKTKFTCIDCSQNGCACDIVNFDTNDEKPSTPRFCPFSGKRCKFQKVSSKCDKRIDKTTDGPKCPISEIVIKDWDKKCDCEKIGNKK